MSDDSRRGKPHRVIQTGGNISATGGGINQIGNITYADDTGPLHISQDFQEVLTDEYSHNHIGGREYPKGMSSNQSSAAPVLDSPAQSELLPSATPQDRTNPFRNAVDDARRKRRNRRAGQNRQPTDGHNPSNSAPSLSHGSQPPSMLESATLSDGSCPHAVAVQYERTRRRLDGLAPDIPAVAATARPPQQRAPSTGGISQSFFNISASYGGGNMGGNVNEVPDERISASHGNIHAGPGQINSFGIIGSPGGSKIQYMTGMKAMTGVKEMSEMTGVTARRADSTTNSLSNIGQLTPPVSDAASGASTATGYGAHTPAGSDGVSSAPGTPHIAPQRRGYQAYVEEAPDSEQ